MRRKIAIIRSRQLICVSLIVGAAIACKDTAWTPRGSAETVLSEIKVGGAANVAKRIDADESFGRSVMNGVETGDSAWLQVAANITPASGAAAASLSIALASALPRSPERVLALLVPSIRSKTSAAFHFSNPIRRWSPATMTKPLPPSDEYAASH